jgi:hypothetical protein
MMNNLIPEERIESKIFVIRGQKVMLDIDLAALYEVSTKAFNQAVKRNKERFTNDFMFQLTWTEVECLRSQIVTLKKSKQSKRGTHVKYLPYAFSENGVAMLSSVLRSKWAIEVNIQIMRAFIARNKDLTYLFKELKQKVNQHDVEIGLIIKAIEKMIATERKPKGKIGFTSD